MKKILAIALALMLLMASAALAETASVLTIANPVLTVNADGQNMSFDMNGLEVTLAMGNAGGTVPTLQLDAANAGQKLLGAVMQVIDGKVVVDIDGLSRPIAAAMPAGSETAADGLAEAFASLPEIAGAKLPAFTGVDIPKLDLMSVGQMIGAQGDGQSASFELPYEMVNMVLSQITQYKDAIPEAAQPYLGPIFDAIDQMQATNSGFALTGSITDDGASATLAVDILPVQNGVTADASAATITLYSADNQMNLDVVLHQGGQDMTLGQLAVTSDPAAAELSFSLDIMGMLSFAGSLYPQDGAQVAAFEVVAEGQKLSFSIIYGENEGADFTDLVFSVENQAAVECYVETTADASGAKTGTLALTVDAKDQGQFTLTGDIQSSVQDTALRSIANPGNAIDAENMSAEESEQLNQEIQVVLADLLNYVATLQPAA